MNTYVWPTDPPGNETEILDRTRLMIDLDEATEPGCPPSLFIVAGLPRATGGNSGPAELLVEDTTSRLADVLAVRGAIYRTRSNEVAALLDEHQIGFQALLRELEEAVPDGAGAFAVGFAELPREAADAMSALMLADRRKVPGSAAA